MRRLACVLALCAAILSGCASGAPPEPAPPEPAQPAQVRSPDPSDAQTPRDPGSAAENEPIRQQSPSAPEPQAGVPGSPEPEPRPPELKVWAVDPSGRQDPELLYAGNRPDTRLAGASQTAGTCCSSRNWASTRGITARFQSSLIGRAAR